MSNIHGFNDPQPRNPYDRSSHSLNARRRNQQNQSVGDRSGMFGNFMGGDQQSPLTLQHLKNAEKYKVLFLSGRRRVKNPMEQNYFDMLIDSCCPTITCLSITVLIFIVTLVMFIIEVSMGLYKAGDFLQVDAQTLLNLGANYQPYVKQGEVYRLIAPIFLHINFMHFFGNFIAILIFLTRVQYTVGPLKAILIYIISGIGGNIFSILIQTDSIKAGASTSLYGIIGFILGYIVINWNGLAAIGPILKYQLFCTSIMIIFFIFFFTPSTTTNVDTFGHLGGFLTGLWLTSIHSTINNQTCQKTLRIVFFSLFTAQFVVCFTIFFVT